MRKYIFLVVTPKILMRILGKESEDNLKKNIKETYWVKKDNSNNNFKNQF